MMARRLRLLVAGLALASGAARASPVLLVSLDGLRSDDVVHAAERGLKLPRLTALLHEGAYADGVQGVLPTLTYPSHTTLITGVAPSTHGIGNNLTFDPLGRNQTGWDWYATDIRVPTLWQAAHDRGLKTANVHWPVSVGAKGVDLNLPQIWRADTPDDAKLLAALATPGLLPRLGKGLGAYPAGADESVAGDAGRVRFATAIMAADRPDLLTAYLAGIDHQEHATGPDSPEARAAIERTDALVGALIDAARAAHPDVTIAVVSDHGFLPVTTDINLFAPFIAEGLITLGPDGKVASWQAEPWIAGGTATIMLARPDDAALTAKVAALLAGLRADPGYHITDIFDAAEVRRRGGPAGASFLIAMAPGYETGRDPAAPREKPSVYKGMHGYIPDLPAMRSLLVVAGPSLAHKGNLGLVDMRAIAPSLARVLGVALPTAEKPAVF